MIPSITLAGHCPGDKLTLMHMQDIWFLRALCEHPRELVVRHSIHKLACFYDIELYLDYILYDVSDMVQ